MDSSCSHTQSWAPCSPGAHASFADVEQHLDDHPLLFDELILVSQLHTEASAASHPKAKAKVLFQFFDGWPMTDP